METLTNIGWLRIQYNTVIRLYINGLRNKNRLSLECVKRIHTICNIKSRFFHNPSSTYGMERLVKYPTIHYVSVPVHDEHSQ